MQLTRRALLLAAGGVALAGCRSGRSGPAPQTVGDRAAAAAALTAERELLAGYDLAITRLDAVAAIPLARARARHALHVAALEAAGGSATPSASASPPATPPADGLRAAMRRSVRALQTAAIRTTEGDTAALLASIAAEHAADVALGADA